MPKPVPTRRRSNPFHKRTKSPMPEWVSTAQIGAKLRISRQAAHDLTRKVGFPEPVAVVSRGTRIFNWIDVGAWLVDNRPSVKGQDTRKLLYEMRPRSVMETLREREVAESERLRGLDEAGGSGAMNR